MMLNIFSDKEKISASQIADYTFCPRYFYLKYVEEISPEPSEGAVKNKFLKKFFQLLLKKENSIIRDLDNPSDKDQVLDTYKDYSVDLIGKSIPEKEISYIEKAEKELKKEIDFILMNNLEMRSYKVSIMSKIYEKTGRDLADKIAPIRPKELELESEKLELYGEIDLIDLNGKDYIPNLIKVGKMPERDSWGSYKNKLKVFSLLMEEDLETETPVGMINYPLFLNKVPVILDDKEEVLELKKEAENILNNEEVPKEKKNCSICEFSYKC